MRSRSSLGTVAQLCIGAAGLGIAGLGACNPLHRRGAATSDVPPVVIFENQSLEQAAVYVVTRGGPETRIGTVQAGRTDTLTVGTAALGGSGSVAIVARLLAISRTPSTGPLTLQPGDRIHVTLPSDARVLSVLPARSP
jgi:hypothetical protein